MPLTQSEITKISGIIEDAIDDLLKFPSEKQSQALTALQLMLKDGNLNGTEETALSEWTSTIRITANSTDLAKLYKQDGKVLGNVNLIKTLLNHPNISEYVTNIESNQTSTATNEEIKTYIRGQISSHITSLKEQGIKPIEIGNPTKQQVQNYKKHIDDFINRVKTDTNLQIALGVLAVSGLMGGTTYAGIKLHNHMQEQPLKELEVSISKKPEKEQELISEFLNRNLRVSPTNNVIIDRLLPRVTNSDTFISALNSVITTRRPDHYSIKQLLSHINNIEALDIAYNTAKNAPISTILIFQSRDNGARQETLNLIAKRQQALTIQELESAIARSPERTQEFILTALTKQLSIYPDNKDIINKFLPQITDSEVFNALLKAALSAKELDLSTISKLVPHVTDIAILDEAKKTVKDKDSKFVKEIENRREEVSPTEPQILALRDAIKQRHTQAIIALIPRVSDQKALGEVADYAIKRHKKDLLESLDPSSIDQETLSKIAKYTLTWHEEKLFNKFIPYLTDQEALSKLLLDSGNPEISALEKIATQLHDEKIINSTTQKAISRGHERIISLLISKITDQGTLSAVANYFMTRTTNKRNDFLDKLIPRITGQEILRKALTHYSRKRNNDQIEQVIKRIEEVANLNAASTIQTNIAIMPEAVSSNTLLPSTTKHSIAEPSSSAALSTNPNSHLSASPVSMSESTTFAMHTMLAIAMVLKLCRIGRFSNFALPSTPAQIQLDHKLPEREFDVNKYQKLLSESPQAQTIAQYIKHDIEQSGSKEVTQTDITRWTQSDIVKFVNSPDFNKFQEAIKEATRTSRRATEEDFGVESSAIENQKASTQNKKPRGR